MWPSKVGLGASITYGMTGPNLFLSQYDEDKPWQFPRGRDMGQDFHLLKDSFKEIQKPVIPKLRKVPNIIYKNDDIFSDIPNEVLKKYETEQKLVESDLVYDPAIGDVLKVTKIKAYHRNHPYDVVAYSGGFLKNVLIVKPMTYEEGTISYASAEESYNRKNTTKKDDPSDTEILIPEVHSNTGRIELDSTIRQIECFQNSSNATFQIHFQHFVIRTVRSIYLIKAHIQGLDKSISLKIIHYLNCEEFHGFEFSHIATDPFTLERIAAIDTKGNWLVMRMSKFTKAFQKICKGVILDFEDMSGFKRIKWLDNSDEIVLISRIAIKKVNLKTDQVTELVSGNRWSNMRDYLPYGSNDHYAFLLTSRELFLIDVKNGFKRLLSWKHFLNPSDPSLRFTVKAVREVNCVLVYSSMEPLLFLYQFKFIKDLPVMIHDPVCIRDTDVKPWNIQIVLNQKGNKKVPKSKQTGDEDTEINIDDDDDDDDEDDLIDDNSCTIFKLSTALQVSRQIISTKPGTFVQSHPANQDMQEKEQEREEEKKEAPACFDYRKDVFAIREHPKFIRLSKALDVFPLPCEEMSEQEQIDALTKYTESLSIEKSQDPSSVLEKSIPLNVFEFDEYDEIIQQLNQHCHDIDLDITPFTKYLSSVIPEETINGKSIKDISSLSQAVADIYQHVPEKFHHLISRDLPLSLHTITDRSKEEQELEEARSSLRSSKLQKILSSWENEFEEYTVDTEDYGTQGPKLQHHTRFDTQPDEWSQPTIKVTQSQRPPFSSQVSAGSSSQARPSNDSMRPIKRERSEISSSQIPSGSQSQSGGFGSSQAGFGAGSSQRVKKKKRKSGFA